MIASKLGTLVSALLLCPACDVQRTSAGSGVPGSTPALVVSELALEHGVVPTRRSGVDERMCPIPPPPPRRRQNPNERTHRQLVELTTEQWKALGDSPYPGENREGRCIRVAAVQGDRDAMYDLAKRLFGASVDSHSAEDEAELAGMEPDAVEGLVWLRRAADAGQLDAMTDLGIRLSRLGMRDEGLFWLSEAALGGSRDGLFILGRELEATSDDLPEAANCYRASALLGHRNAGYWLGRLLARRPGLRESGDEDIEQQKLRTDHVAVPNR